MGLAKECPKVRLFAKHLVGVLFAFSITLQGR